MSWVSFDVLKHHEDPEKDWRRAFQEQLDASITQYRKWRHQASQQLIGHRGNQVKVCYATNSQITAHCEYETRRDFDRAIIQHDRQKARCTA